MDNNKAVTFEFFVKDYIQKLYPYVHGDIEAQLIHDREFMAFDGAIPLGSNAEIDVLIVTQQLANVMKSTGMKFGRDASIAWDTYFGWGETIRQDPELPRTINMVHVQDNMHPEVKDPRLQQLDRDLKVFWELEHLGILPNEASESEFL
jgi:hypothetical protein